MYQPPGREKEILEVSGSCFEVLGTTGETVVIKTTDSKEGITVSFQDQPNDFMVWSADETGIKGKGVFHDTDGTLYELIYLFVFE